MLQEITLTTDASEHSVSEILSQKGHSIMYLWRRLTNAKLNYSNIERAIVWKTITTLQFLTRKKKISVKMWSETIRMYIQSKERIA